MRIPISKNFFESVWAIRNSHIVTGLPSYIFMLLVALSLAANTHVVLKENSLVHLTHGIQVDHLSLTFLCPNLILVDPGGGSCSTCKDFCSGHYCEPTFTDVTDKDALKQVSSPPFVCLKTLFTKLKGKSATEDILESAARKVLLPAQEVGFWFEHLNTVAENRRRGAAKAAETRRRKQGSSDSSDRYTSVGDVRLSTS